MGYIRRPHRGSSFLRFRLLRPLRAGARAGLAVRWLLASALPRPFLLVGRGWGLLRPFCGPGFGSAAAGSVVGPLGLRSLGGAVLIGGCAPFWVRFGLAGLFLVFARWSGQAGLVAPLGLLFGLGCSAFGGGCPVSGPCGAERPDRARPGAPAPLARLLLP